MQDSMRFVSGEGTTHRLSFVVRLNDHFSGQPVPDLLQVGLRGYPQLPVVGPGGSRRQADGTYRFIGLPDGPYRVSVLDAKGQWTTFDASLDLSLPVTDPTEARAQDLWPTSARSSRPGETSMRGRLLDASTDQPLQGRRIEIGPLGGPWTRHSFTDADGEVFYPFHEFVAPQADGTLQLEARVDEGAATVDEIQTDGNASTPGPIFAVQPGRETRLRLWVMP